MGFIRNSVALAIAVVAGLATGLPPDAKAASVQVTEDHSGSGCASVAPVSDSSGTIAAWQSSCNPAGGNGDGSNEIFRATVGAAPVQLTAGTGCSSGRPSISADGARIAFESDCDLLGTNADGNVEIFLWKNGVLVQLTTSTFCDNLAPSISGSGGFVAFDSTCNLFGINDGHGSEIFRVTVATLALKQLTSDASGACDSTSASIDNSGNLVAFDSDCDLTGHNEDLATEIFTVSAASEVVQRTFAGDDSCSSVRPSMDAAGSLIAFLSNCDPVGTNSDLSDEVFTVDDALEVRQISNADAGSACASGEPHMASSGHAVAYSSYCALADGRNADGSIEVFQAGVGNPHGGILAVTDDSGCSSSGGGISADGSRVMLDSDCDLAGSNADAGVEVFRAGACACGAPATRNLPPKKPLASDALFVLKSAVGSAVCAKCECDTNNDSQINASDALRTLKAAVGTVTLTCPAA